MTTEQEREQYISELQVKAEKLQKQKELLLKELNTAESSLETTVRMYSKFFPPIIDYIKDGNKSFTDAMSLLSRAMKQRKSVGNLENLFSQIHTAMLKDSPGERSSQGKSSIFSNLLKSTKDNNAFDPDEYLNTIKEGYVGLINAMKESFDSSHGVKLNGIATKLQNANNFDTIKLLQDQLSSLLKQYIYNIDSDREKMGTFVKEIVKRILKIEAGINQSFNHTRTSVNSSEELGSLMDKEISSLKTNMNVSDNIDDLKNQVTQTLSTIEKALEEKAVKDKSIKIISEENRSEFQTGFSKLKKELDQAIKHSKDLETKLNQDPLTKAFNRRAYNKRITNEMARFSRYKTIFSILVIDIDLFKNVNDTYGHAIGDKCLQEITRRATPVFRQNDMFVRYGGEEFVVIIPETDTKGAAILAEKIRQTIEKIEFIYKKDTIKMTVSIGVSEVKEGDKTHETVFERADSALYKAKSEGRNRVCTG